MTTSTLLTPGKKKKQADKLQGDRQKKGEEEEKKKVEEQQQHKMELPEGWRVEVKTKNNGQKYKTYYSPEGKSFPSLCRVMKAIESRETGYKLQRKTPSKKIQEMNESMEEDAGRGGGGGGGLNGLLDWSISKM